MQNLKNFQQFLNEKTMDNVQDLEFAQLNKDFKDVQLDNDYDFDEEIIQITYDKKLEEWIYDGELGTPEDFEDFYNWFLEIDEDKTLATLKEDDDEVVFNIPKHNYVEYFERTIMEEPDEEIFEEEDDNDDFDHEIIDDDINDDEDWDDND